MATARSTRTRAGPARIAVLEYDLFGITPAPGSLAAAVVALRQVGTCLRHEPVDIITWSDAPSGRHLCTRCGNHLGEGDDGSWSIAGHDEEPFSEG